MLQFQHQSKHARSARKGGHIKNIVNCPHCGKPIKAQELIKSLDKFERVCVVCGKTFIASNSAKYCSNACKQRAKYARQKQQKTQGENNGNSA